MFSGVKDAVSGAKDAVSDIASGAADVGRAAKDVANEGFGLVLERDIFELDSLKGMVRGAAEVLTAQRTMGSVVGGALDSLGLPDWTADLATAAVDTMTGRPDSSIPHVLSATSGMADKAGLDDAADFLGTASDVTGMAGEAARSGALNYVTGSDDPGALFSKIDEAGELGSLGKMAGQATEVADQVDTAVDTAEAMREGDVETMSGGVSQLMDANLGTLEELMADSVDPELIEAIREAMAANDGLLAEAVVEAAGAEDEEVGLGTELFASEPGQQLLENVVEAAEAQESRPVEGVEVEVRSVVFEMSFSVEGLLDMASFNADVALEVSQTLFQTGALTGAEAVSDILGLEVRG